MIITKVALPRRTIVRGLGAALALPLLDAMVPAMTATVRTAAAPVRRLGFVYVPNGQNMPRWTPKGLGRSFELSPTLLPLAKHKEQLFVATGLTHHQAESLGDGNGEHTRAQATWLNGVHPKWTEGADVRAGITVDQTAALTIGKDTRLPSLELALESTYQIGNCDNGYSCIYMNTMSWRNATTPLPSETNPRMVFERLFGDGGTASQRRTLASQDRSILDGVSEDMARLQRRIGASDRVRVDQYFDAVREIERRLQRTETGTQEAAGAANLDRPVGIPDSIDEHARLMFDLQWLAFQADITRVFTYLMGREQTNQTWPASGVTDTSHGISHHEGRADKLEAYARLNTYQISLLAHFVDRLASTQDGDGTLLDHSMTLYGGGLSDGNQHAHVDLPLLVVGGGSNQLGGRHIQYPKETPASNLLLTMLQQAGVDEQVVGDSTGTLAI